jgi:molybdate transport system substrate-binding protein
VTIRRAPCLSLGRLLGWLVLVTGSAVAAEEARGAPPREQPALLVFAAASLTDALGEVDREFTAHTGIAVKASFAASSVLAKQVEAGAPADVFFSADVPWVDYLDQRGLLKAGTRHDLLGNALVLIAPADSTVQLSIAPRFQLLAALGEGRLAMADPDSVPAGRYAREALTRLDVWDSISGRLARAENVRAALAYVARGEVPLGIVYQTDAQAEKRVRIVAVFPADTHPPITYPVALTARARPQATRFTQFLMGESARRIFERYGFVPLSSPRAVK